MLNVVAAFINCLPLSASDGLRASGGAHSMGCSSSKEAVPSSSASQKKGTPVSPSAKHGSEGIAAQDNMVRRKINFIYVLIFNIKSP